MTLKKVQQRDYAPAAAVAIAAVCVCALWAISAFLLHPPHQLFCCQLLSRYINIP
jgi:hypothetical protein